MALGLEGKICLVTGAAGGIGRASALAFAREGAKVVVADVEVAGGEETVRMIKGKGGEALFIKADMAKAAEVNAMFQKVMATYGRLDCAHNNAGVGSTGKKMAEETEDDWDRIITINLKGVWWCMKQELVQMLKQGGGSIVNTASVLGLTGQQGRGVYAASKHGIVGFTQVAALEYARDNIRVNAVCPGVINTAIIARAFARGPEERARIMATEPIGRLGEPEEVAEAVVWLSSPAASFVTGHCLAVDGGWLAT